MEKIYYKGYLYNIANIKNINQLSYIDFEDSFNDICNFEDNIEIGNILHEFYISSDEKKILNNKLLINKFDNIFKTNKYMFNNKLVSDENCFIFEIIKDNNNEEFAKEIFTNQIFPLIKYDNINIQYIISSVFKVYDSDTHHRKDYKYKLDISYSHNKENILKLTRFFYFPFCEIANQNQIDSYLNEKCKNKNIFKKNKENTKLKEKIITYSKSNVFKNEIIEKKEQKIEREKQDKLTLYMEKIEYLLLKLDKINHNIKEEKQNKYNKLLNEYNSDLTTSPLNIETLKMLEAEIEFAIKYNSKSENNILDTLENIINEYNTSNTTNRTINDIDELVRLFLQMKTNYSPIVQRNAIEKFALIYIYEIYENKEIITTQDLSNSYINDLLTSILICLNNMIDNNEIENNIIIKLEGDITLDYILNCIKEINFIKNKKLTI